MSRSPSPRSQAILDAVLAGASDVAGVTDRLDLAPPDERWMTLARADRAANVRRCLSRLVDAGEVVRLGEGTYGGVWPVRTSTAEPDEPAPTLADHERDQARPKQTSPFHDPGHTPRKGTPRKGTPR